MFKNMRIRTKLLVVTTALIVAPLVVVAYVSVARARSVLTGAADLQLTDQSTEIARGINQVMDDERRITGIIADESTLVQAAQAADRSVATTTAPSTASISRDLHGLIEMKGAGDDVAAILATNRQGIVFAASTPLYLGKSLAATAYVQSALGGRTDIGADVIDNASGATTIPLAAPIPSPVNGRPIGTVVQLLKVGFARHLIADAQLGRSGRAFIVGRRGDVVATSSARTASTRGLLSGPGGARLKKRMLSGQRGVLRYTQSGTAETAAFAPVPLSGWSVGMSLSDMQYLAAANEVRNIAVIVGLIGIAIALLVLVLFLRSITRPLNRAVDYAKAVASGDLTRRLHLSGNDEVGILTAALNQMVDRLNEMIVRIRETARQTSVSAQDISTNAHRLSAGAQEQAATLEETSASVEELNASVDQVAHHAQSQVTTAQQTSSSMVQMSSTVSQVSKTLSEVSKSSEDSMLRAQSGMESVSKAVEAIKSISESSGQIAGIIGVIDDIADQTNLLALNASIEAARAGEHGRGFAVVANEVSALADRSSSSTKEIAELIGRSSDSVKRGVEIAQEVLESMREIVAGAKRTNEAIEGLASDMEQQVSAIREVSQASEAISEMSKSISAAAEEQSAGARQVSEAIENVNELSQQAATAAEEMSSATEELNAHAQRMQGFVEQFTLEEAKRGEGLSESEYRAAPTLPAGADGNQGEGVTVNHGEPDRHEGRPQLLGVEGQDYTRLVAKSGRNGNNGQRSDH